jgi:hypothetical protein
MYGEAAVRHGPRHGCAAGALSNHEPSHRIASLPALGGVSIYQPVAAARDVWLGRGCTGGALANIRATHRYNSLPFETGLSLKRAKEILFLQRFVLAEEARELGIINRVVSPPEELDRELLELARQIASADPFHLQMMKRMANSAAEAAGLETVARQNLYTWATYRWDWSARGHAAGDGASGVSILDAVHFD